MTQPSMSSSAPRAHAWSGARFALLAQAHWAEHARRYAMDLLIVAVLYVVLLAVMLPISELRALTTETQVVFYFIGLMLSGSVFAARYFHGMTRRESALLVLMRPASVLEKWALCALWVALAYPLAYTAAFVALTWPAQQLVVHVLPLLHTGGTDLELDRYALYVPWLSAATDSSHVPGWRAHVGWWVSLWAVQAYALGMTLYFHRAGALRALLLGIALVVLTMGWTVWTDALPDLLFGWWAGDGGALSGAEHALCAAFWLGVPALLWRAVYVNLQDRELL